MSQFVNPPSKGLSKTSSRVLIIPTKSIHDNERELAAMLMDCGVQVMQSGRSDFNELFALSMDAGLQEFVLMKQPGWYGATFVMPSGEIVGEGSERLLLDNPAITKLTWTKGDPERFKVLFRNIWIHGSDMMRLAILVAAASPLMGYCGIEPKIIALTGTSSTGKSSALKIAAAFSGHPTGKDGSTYLSLRTTDNALEGTLADRSGMTLSLDETRQFLGGLQQLVFMIVEGKGKGRSNQHGEAREVKTFQSCALLSSETPIADLVREDGDRVVNGMNVRCFDVDVSQVEPAKDEHYHHIMQEIDQCYGHGLPMLIEQILTETPEELRHRIDQEAKCLLEQLSEKPLPYHKRAAQKFAVLTVASTLLEDAGLIPTEAVEGEAGDGSDIGPEPSEIVDWAWRQTVASRDVHYGDHAGRAVAELRKNLIAKVGREFVNLDDKEQRNFGDRLAFYSAIRNCIYLPTEQMKKWSGNAVQLAELTKRLKEEGYLIPASVKNLQHATIPSEGKQKHYRLRRNEFLGLDEDDGLPAPD